MNLKIGDKVKFLNQNGGGIVVKILSPQMVSVAIEDGFEIPIMVNELLKVEEVASGSAKLFQNNKMFENIEEVPQQEDDTENEPEYERISPLKKLYNASQVPNGIYLAFEPHEQRWLLTGNLDVYLINHTSNSLLFSLFLRHIETNNFVGQDYDALPPYSKILLATIGREDIYKWNSGVLQGLFHTENTSKVLNPLNVEFKVKEMRFLKEDNYRIIPILDQKALVVSMANLQDISTFAENKKENLQAKENQETETSLKGKILQNPLLNNTDKAEIDLHIDVLAQDSSHLSPAEMLSIQLEHFEKYLNAAIENHLEQITFIHGVGSGKLKSEMIQVLKQYDGLHWFDAPMSRYGVGATDVLIGQNTKKNVV